MAEYLTRDREAAGSSLSGVAETHLSLLSTGSTQDDPSWHNWKIVVWDVKNQIKQTGPIWNMVQKMFLGLPPSKIALKSMAVIAVGHCSLLFIWKKKLLVKNILVIITFLNSECSGESMHRLVRAFAARTQCYDLTLARKYVHWGHFTMKSKKICCNGPSKVPKLIRVSTKTSCFKLLF